MDQKFGPPANEAQRRLMEQIEREQRRQATDPELAAQRRHIKSSMQYIADPPPMLSEQSKPAAKPKRRTRRQPRS